MTPRRQTHRVFNVASAALLALVMASAARAQPMLQPVDPAVGDLDLLSHNLRVVEPGLRSIGEQSNLFTLQPLAPGSIATNTVPVYYRLGPGFRARVDRMEYIVPVDERTARRNVTPVRDGFYLERFPANTVFELSARFEAANEPPPSAPDAVEFPTNRADSGRAFDWVRSPQLTPRFAGQAPREPSEDFRLVPRDRSELEPRYNKGVIRRPYQDRLDSRIDLRVNNRVDTLIDDRVDLRSPVRANDVRE